MKSARTGTMEDRVSAHLDALERTQVRGGISRRKAQGAHYTPRALVDHLVTEAMNGLRPADGEWRALDPACGSGNFLVAVAEAIARRSGAPMSRVLSRWIHGVDIDPVAVTLARRSLLALLPARTSEAVRRRVRAALVRHVVAADAITWKPDACFLIIVGNPPFLNQLERGTAASRLRARTVSDATGGAVRRYADLASAFLIVSLGHLAPRGRLAFVMPQSFLSTADAHAARSAALDRARLRAIWSCEKSLFEDASVRVCGLVFCRGTSRSVRRAFGTNFAPISGRAPHPQRDDASWAPLLAEGFGAPRVEGVAPGGNIADIATATADFRDQYYGLRDAIEENGSGPRLATTRHIDLGTCAWGECEVRVLGQRYTRPTIEPSRTAGRKGMDGWLGARLVPKVLVATQTRVIEAFVDEQGEYAPLVPIISVFPREGTDLWQLAAAIASPVVAARALALYAGSALGAGAIKLSARQLLAMPLPRDARLWRKSAQLFRSNDFEGFARVSCEAHALSAREMREVLRFWLARV